MPGRLDRSPKANWVEKAGGLPDYIERIAVHLKRKGKTTSHAIAIAINAAKKMCATGDLNWPGLQQVNPGSKAQACAAVARWTAMKASRDAGEEDPEWGDIWHQAAVLDSEDRLHELDNVGDAMNDFSGLEAFDAGPDLDTLAADERKAPKEKDSDFESKHPRGDTGTPEGGQFVVKKGSKGSEVEKVQREVGVKATGEFDDRTEAAVRKFQKEKGLQVDGKVGRQTVAAMQGKKASVGALEREDREFLRPKKASPKKAKRSADLGAAEALGPRTFPEHSAEYRSVPFKDADVKGRRFRGYAAAFDAEADLGEFTEEIRRGAFRKVLSDDPYVPMLFNHNAQLPPLASTRSGMTLKEDGSGLLVDATLANHFAAEAVLEGVERGDIRGMSFGFVAGRGNSDLSQRNGRVHRAITNFNKLLDVSPTHDPAYAETSAEVRSMIRRATLLDDPQTDLSGQQPQTEEPVVEDVEGCEECGEDEHRTLYQQMLVRMAVEAGLEKPTF